MARKTSSEKKAQAEKFVQDALWELQRDVLRGKVPESTFTDVRSLVNALLENPHLRVADIHRLEALVDLMAKTAKAGKGCN